ncbi:outer membrane protein assembly factor BamB family protein [Amycolatopsis magusensis]|uniref:outer membrane protein assembly factor BamB family protein n=1 Tax=Amycolatopsis magusensis TaxID=882444 RepID=UPI0024A97381|nr:PQQ-binding-like beta-propeller repeat protein [Amycolatopsis magusensis]MDI5974946.1 PQQ-binding-like beta-propeller repeat protein [Amycolatopsis magusensis]
MTRSRTARRRPVAWVIPVVCALLAVLAPASAVSNPAASTPGVDPAAGADWPTWTKDARGSRHNAAERRINAYTVDDLQVKWAHAFPRGSGQTLRSQPAVVGDRMYFGGPDGLFYSLDSKTGQTLWTFNLSTVDPAVGLAKMVRDSPSVANGRVYFGDGRGYLYALNQQTGALEWSKRLDTNPSARLTSSPIHFDGRIYVGVASADNAGGVDSSCCTFRGHVDALDAQTGELVWRYYTVPEPKAVGTWPSGAIHWSPSGAGVWSSPVIDPVTRTLYVGTGQNYTGTEGDSDSVLALDVHTGAVRWKNQLTHPDTWRVLCADPKAPPGYCPGLEDDSALDFDIGTAPNVFTVKGRTYVGVGQKSGVYHVLDTQTGAIVWQRQLSSGDTTYSESGIQWGASYDGERLYVATNQGNPGALHALDPETGALLWTTPNPADGCSWGGAALAPASCLLAHAPAVSSSPGVVYEGSSDGKIRAYRARDGKVLWQFDTIQDFQGVNGLVGRGGGLAAAGGAVVSDGMLYVMSGFRPLYPSDKGFVLLAFGR